jgi:glycosyltransferase involved in cell wall biosynthesis
LKILQISASYKPAFVYGGPTMSVSMLGEQLLKADCQVDVFTTTANGAYELEVTPNKPVNIDGVTVTYFKRITKDHSHLSPTLLKRVWNDAKEYQVIHIHAWWNLVSVLSCLIAIWRNVPVVVSARGTLSPYSFQNKNKGIKWLIHHIISKPLLKRCHFHVTSNREKEAISAVIKPKSITSIANFVKLPVYVTSIAKEQFPPFKLIFLSRIEAKKGLDILISALPALTFPYVLTIAGDGDTAYINELKNLANEKQVAGNMNWIGFQYDHKFELLHGHDLLVLPSYDENFGNVVIESLSQGTAVLLSKFVGLSDYAVQNNLGWACELNAEDVATQLNIIAYKQDELIRIRETAPKKIQVDFEEDSLVQQYITMYNHITH